MYCVIFTSKINKLDSVYHSTLQKMRDLSINRYNCIGVSSVCENNEEITVSYWQSLEHIKKWKQDIEHLKAQELGRCNWYKSYNIKITKIIKEYNFTSI